jgi:hypothetical protein
MSYLADTIRETAVKARAEADGSARDVAAEYTDDPEMIYPAYSGLLSARVQQLSELSLQAAKELDKMAAIIEMLDEETLIKLDELSLL